MNESSVYNVAVSVKAGLPDPRGAALQKDARDLGIRVLKSARVSDIYIIAGALTPDDVERICRELLADPLVQDYSIGLLIENARKKIHIIEVAYNPGVLDPVEDSIRKGIRDLGIGGVESVKTAKRYHLGGQLSASTLKTIADKLLVNPVIQHIVAGGEATTLPSAAYSFALNVVDLLAMDDEGLIALSRNRLWLNLDEMKVIRDHFKKIGRNPTDVELETIAQTWSEHCGHKTFKGKITLDGVVIDNLLKSTIMKATRELNKPWCLSVFKDNAGVIEFDEDNAVCFKVETHNHPSAVEPYGGAATGLGGVIRDVLGTGLGAKPVCNTDVFCFGPPDLPYDRTPQGVLHPRRIFKGVRAGVADYGNRMGIPTLNGAVCFDDRYTANPLVFCGTVGVMPKHMAQQGRQSAGDLVVVAGGLTGRDGIHGVTFASGELTAESETVSSVSVQIGNPIVEKKLLDVLLKARDRGLYSRITDCGGGGLSSAVGEMGEETGVRVDLEKVPLKYAGLSYDEIWISESQERMALAVPPDNAAELLDMFAAEGVAAAIIGEFTDDKRLRLFYDGKKVCDLDMEFLHRGLPQLERRARWTPPRFEEPDLPEHVDLKDDLFKILGSWNVCSKEWVIRQYDHEVQGGSVLKPLVGAESDGPGDAAIIRPVPGSDRGIIISNGINPKYGDIDPYRMAASAIDEALRQVIAVGGSLERVALIDNFCWGNPEKPDRMAGLALAARACHDMSLAYGTPFISGKDSLYNEYENGDGSICIPPTLLVSALGVMEDVNRAVTMDCKKAGDLIYVIGLTFSEMGGSHYFDVHGFKGNVSPGVDPARGKAVMDALSAAISKGLVRACHDCSEGGIGVAAAEMAFAGGLGMKLDTNKVPLGEDIERDDFILFSESNSRFIAEVSPEDAMGFERVMKGIDHAAIGRVTEGDIFEVGGRDGALLLSASIKELKEAWQRPLRW
ncbi:MAG: phosphoribosylformylglycinamidine synthase subunit PurL [Dehalococcoidia bacterium]